MNSLISHYNSKPQFPLKFPSKIPKFNTNSTLISPRECLQNPQYKKPNSKTYFRAYCTVNSGISYNGWDDLRHWVDSDELLESNYVQKFLISLGIYDKKYVFTCILGFVVALTISRIRVSSVVVFPAAVVVFGIGFSFGFVNGGDRGVKVESLRVFVEKLGTLRELFDGFEAKVGELRSVVRKGIDDERVELSELERYVSVLDSISGLVLDARSVVEDCTCELSEVERKSNSRSSSKKKGFGSNGFSLLGFLGSFLGGYGRSLKASKRNVLRRESKMKDVYNQAERDMQGLGVEQTLDSLSTLNGSNPRVTESNGGKKNKLGERNREMERISQSDKMSEMEDHIDSGSYLDEGNDRFSYESTRFVDNQSFSFNMSSHREVRKWSVDDGMSSYTEFGVTQERQEEEEEDYWSGFSMLSNEGRKNVDFGNYEASFSQERMNVEDELHTRKYQRQNEKDSDLFSSSMVSDDLLFSKYLTRANDLLKQAKGVLTAKNNEMVAEEMLHESAKLLSQAIEMKPMSLLAIGQLGNTYLLHGELKLRTSRTLRNHLSRNDNLGVKMSNRLLSSVDEARPNKDRIATLLGKTCEDCESLLVQAGRKYRIALSIDKNDVRALYNWGLALSFRAQLIADIGPEAALDADKLFMAAIDKFDAMMSRNNVYAPEALFRWGMALQQRSRLRPSSSRDRIKLLQQAKRLYKDSLDMGSNDIHVRKALTSCMSELNFSDN